MGPVRVAAHAVDGCEWSFEARENCASCTGIVIASDTVGASGLLSIAALGFLAAWKVAASIA